MIKKFSCSECGKIYSRANTLKGHINVVHKGKCYICTYENCKDSFLRKDDLNSHLLGHEGKYRFVCHICGKGYNHKASYQSHSNTHFGLKKCSNVQHILNELHFGFVTSSKSV